MADPASGRAVVVWSNAWHDQGGEQAFVTRSLAGALSLLGPVEVVTGELARPDGLFDLRPSPPEGLEPVLVVVEQGDGAALTAARAFSPRAPLVSLGSGGPLDPEAGVDARWVVGPLGPVGPGTTGAVEIDLHVPVNALAAVRPHNGLGFVDYLLVLTDRGGAEGAVPTAAAAWLAAAFPRRHLVVVEGGVATVWRHRSRRGAITVDTRTDLWRLMAHAWVTIDLGPGPVLARECVESLRFATPVVVPDGTAAARLVAAGGGLRYGDVDQLLGAVETLEDGGRRTELAATGRAEADARYGDADRFVRRVAEALALVPAS